MPDSVRKGKPVTIRGCQPKMSFSLWPTMPSRFLPPFSVMVDRPILVAET
jgi:hypothetical protein